MSKRRIDPGVFLWWLCVVAGGLIVLAIVAWFAMLALGAWFMAG